VLNSIDEHPRSIAGRLDPRVRVVLGAACSLTPLFLTDWTGLGIVLVAAACVLAYEGIPSGLIARRLVMVNLFMAGIVALLPWGVLGEALFSAGSLQYSREGLAQSLRILLRGNAVVMFLLASLATMNPIDLAHALQRLRVPRRLVLLLMFTVRYLRVFESEYGRLRQAMRARAFHPGMNAHTLRSIGFLVGMLLVRAFERSERVQQAMLCRGFQGHFHTHRHLRLRRLDRVALAAVAVAIVSIAVLELA
jgi:cobalt/nickel transport system permease protein